MAEQDRKFMCFVASEMVDAVRTVVESLELAKNDFVEYGADPKRIDAIRNLLNLSVSDLKEIGEVIRKV